MVPSHFNHSGVAVTAVFLAVTLICTGVLWRDRKHEIAIRWLAGSFVSLLTLVLAFYDDRHATPSMLLNLMGTVAAGSLAAFIYVRLWSRQWPDGRRAKFFVAAKRCLISAVSSVGANFFVYANVQQHPFAAMIGDGVLFVALVATIVNGVLACLFWIGSRRDDEPQETPGDQSSTMGP